MTNDVDSVANIVTFLVQITFQVTLNSKQQVKLVTDWVNLRMVVTKIT